VRAARPVADGLATDPKLQADWLRCGGTWFAGVNVFPNGPDGRVGQGPPLAGAALDFVHQTLGLEGFAWDPAQVSVCYPDYPQPWDGETDAAFRYRQNRDAAHVDGLRRVGPERRRFLDERHGFILGLPLTEAVPGAAPFVIWEGSHEVMRRAFTQALAGVPVADWGEVDLTEVYHAARRECFETLPRVEVSAPVGGAYIAHRLALHGVGSWRAPQDAPPRSIAYFRPDPFPTAAPDWWLSRP
jgi:hypothetical protein